MDQNQLITEGEAIAKPCFILTSQPQGEVVGYWGGVRGDIPNSLPPEVTRFVSRRHLVTVSDGLLVQLGIDRLGPISLFEWVDTAGKPHLRVERDPRIQFNSFTCSGEPLYATESSSFPPFEALCLHGSPAIAAWLASLGLQRHEYWKVPRDSISEYLAAYQHRFPLFEVSADAIVGGWHIMWPEDDFYMPAEMIQLMLTLRDAEPWYSIWYSPMSQGCFARMHVS